MKIFRKAAAFVMAAVLCLQAAVSYTTTTADAATTTKEMTRNIEEGFNGAFNAYRSDGSFNSTESMLLLDGEAAWCIEPRTNVGPGWTEFTLASVSGTNWLKNRYGWSAEKVSSLSKAVYFAKNYFGDKAADYVLVQNLLWSSITAAEDASQSGSYVLTNNSEAYRSQLDTKAKLDAVMATIWAKVSDYNKQPSWNGSTITGEIGKAFTVRDSNSVSDDVTFAGLPVGITVTKSASGLSIKADNSYAGKTVTLSYYKSQIPYSAFSDNGINIFEYTGRQSISMWDTAMGRVTGKITVTFPYGRGGVGKKDSQTGKVVAGATYYVYSDRACTKYADDINGSHTLVTISESPWVETLLTYKAGTYYVKEETAPPGYARNEDVLTLNIEAGKTSFATVSGAATGWNYDIPIGDAYIKKVSSTDSDTAVGNAEYTVYTDEACTTVAKDINGNDAVFTTTADGSGSNLITFECGTYYVKETKAPDHYTVSDEVYTLTVTRGKTCTVDSGEVSDSPKARARLKKQSTNFDMTEDNGCYSLEWAVYGIYTDPECSELIEKLTTNASGDTDWRELDPGIYYIREITASLGYRLSDEVLEIELQPGDRKTFTMEEVPVTDSFHLQIMKGDAETEEFSAQGTASLEGAVFEAAYYDNTDGDSSGTAMKKWYFRTDENGELYCSNSDCLVSSYTMNDGTVYTSDDLYRDEDGNIIYPLGTYKIREVSPPKYYQLSGSMCFVGDQYNAVSITDGLTAVISEKDDKAVICTGSGKEITGTNLAIAAYDEIYRGFVVIQKYDTDGSMPLQGVGFKLVGTETGETFTGFTDADGKLVFENLVPQHYTLTETSTVDGHALLKDTIEITLPLEMTEDEINKSGADIDKAVWDEAAQAYCFYEAAYEISNKPSIDMPMSGGNTRMLYAGMAAAIGFVCSGVFLTLRLRRKTDI